MNTISRLFASVLILCSTAAAAQKPSVIRTQPEGELKTYQRSGDAFYAYYGEPAMTDQNNTVINIVTAPDGKTIYMKDPISQANAGTWVKGTIGEDGRIHIPLGQCVQYFNMGYGWKTVVLRMGEYDDFVGATYYIDDDMQEVTFSYSADGNTITMDDLGGTDAGGYPGAMYALVYTDDDSFVGYADYHSVYTPFDMTYATLPEGAEREDWTFTYSNAQEGEYETLPVAIEGNNFYLGGLSLHDPDAAIVGTIITADEDSSASNDSNAAAASRFNAAAYGNIKVSFPSDQYVGHHSGFLLYAFGASYETKTFYDEAWDETYTTNVMTPEPTLDLYYDAATRTLAPATDMALVLNMGKANDYGINYMSVSLDPNFEAPADTHFPTDTNPDGITSATATSTSPTYYDLNGRRLTSPASNGVTIIRKQDGKSRTAIKRIGK